MDNQVHNLHDSIRMTQHVLGKQHIILDELHEPDRAYITILERFPRIDIDQFNKLLDRQHINRLGIKSNSKKSKCA